MDEVGTCSHCQAVPRGLATRAVTMPDGRPGRLCPDCNWHYANMGWIASDGDVADPPPPVEVKQLPGVPHEVLTVGGGSVTHPANGQVVGVVTIELRDVMNPGHKVQTVLLDLVWAGYLLECLPEAIGLAKAAATPPGPRSGLILPPSCRSGHTH